VNPRGGWRPSTPALGLLELLTGEVEPALVEVVDRAVGGGGPDHWRDGLGELAVALLAVAFDLGDLARARPPVGLDQLLGLLLDAQVLAVQVDEDRHLGAQHVLVDGLHQVVDRAHRVAAVERAHVGTGRGQEDDGRVARTLALLDDRRDLEAVHVGQEDVEQDDRVLALQHPPERFLAALRGHQVVEWIVEDALHHQQILGRSSTTRTLATAGSQDRTVALPPSFPPAWVI
jgi:hypothetical protein